MAWKDAGQRQVSTASLERVELLTRSLRNIDGLVGLMPVRAAIQEELEREVRLK